jgi:carboxypeptidase Q
MKHLSVKLLSALFLLFSTCAFAQENVDNVAFAKIRQAEMKNSHIPQIAHYLTDVAGARLTNSPGFYRAANWAIETMKSWGLVNAALEPWGEFGKQWELQDFNMAMKLPYPQPLRAYAEPWSINTNGTLTGSVFIITPAQLMDTTYIAAHANGIKNKFVLVTGDTLNTTDNFKPTAERLADTALADMKDTYMIPPPMAEMYKSYFKSMKRADIFLKNYGALALITSDAASINGTVFVQWYYGYKVPANETIPRVDMALEDAQKLKRLVASGQQVELSLNLTGKSSTEDTKGYDVVAEIPGTDPRLKSELVMLGGHLDSWQAATGATDNAAGCMVMMEAVRLLDSLHLKPKRTIRIALWSGEEQGLLGSFNYVRNHFMSDDFKVKPEQEKVSVYFNLDNGTGRIRGIFAQNNPAV